MSAIVGLEVAGRTWQDDFADVAKAVDRRWAPPEITTATDLARGVVGLDLSITGTGIAYADGSTRCLTLPGSYGDARLDAIVVAVMEAVDSAAVDLVVIEDLPISARAAGVTGMVHGVVRRTLLINHVPYALVPPATLKKYATGKGNAPKPDLRMALYKRTGVDDANDNRVDAAWLRMMGLDRLGRPVVTMPESHRASLDKVRWPT